MLESDILSGRQPSSTRFPPHTSYFFVLKTADKKGEVRPSLLKRGDRVGISFLRARSVSSKEGGGRVTERRLRRASTKGAEGPGGAVQGHPCRGPAEGLVRAPQGLR